MGPSPFAPRAHVFVCANRRDGADPLGAGCGAAGERVFADAKQEVARRRAFSRVWVTKTHCMGVCPKDGAAVAVYAAAPADGGRVLTGAVHGDAPAIIDEAERLAMASGRAEDA